MYLKKNVKGLNKNAVNIFISIEEPLNQKKLECSWQIYKYTHFSNHPTNLYRLRKSSNSMWHERKSSHERYSKFFFTRNFVFFLVCRKLAENDRIWFFYWNQNRIKPISLKYIYIIRIRFITLNVRTVFHILYICIVTKLLWEHIC